MHPWERRLRDLAHLLSSCGTAYFDPDLFRRNANQFLQTARTVTFIVQKNKAEIPDFETWYKHHVLAPWSSDTVMTWAKDSRNVIEKEGDIEMHSTLRATIVFSHIASQDIALTTTKIDLLRANIAKLLKFAATNLPAPIADAAIVKIERRWVANSLPDHELIHAMTYVYGRMHAVCTALAHHLGARIDSSIPDPVSLDPSANDVGMARYLKIAKPGIARFETARTSFDRSRSPPEAITAITDDLKRLGQPSSLLDAVTLTAKMAEATFMHFGNHVPMLFLFDDEWRVVDFLSAKFTDQADKFIFWRHAAERASYLRARALVWISESWLRDLTDQEHLPIRDLPIKGELLHVIGADMTGETEVIEWEIRRPMPKKKPTLHLVEKLNSTSNEGAIFFTRPVIEAMQAVRAESAG